jgi:hypothetical protein
VGGTLGDRLLDRLRDDTCIITWRRRLALLDCVPHANPRSAKLAFGLGAMWPLIEEG